jgi:phosphate transport system protein
VLNVRQTFHEELAILEQQLLQMGTLTIKMVHDAVVALQQSDVMLAEYVISQDDVVDGMDIDIETKCMNLLALQQPMARDLRKIGTALKVITDLERIGDHAVDIAKIGRKITQQFFVNKPLVDIGPLSEMAQEMLSDSLEALVRHDIALAHKICVDDDRVDEEFKHLRTELFTLTQNDSTLIAPASYMLLAVVYLERIADHATNIAERVNYVETGHLEQLARSHRLESMPDTSSH